MEWSYFDKREFEEANEKYLPSWGEGDNMATQICTAVNKIIYKWYNDGDVYDNTYSLTGWCNDLSSYANWLRKYAGAYILDNIRYAETEEDYENILVKLADNYLDMDFLNAMAKRDKDGSVYNCTGPFIFNEHWDEDDEEEEIYWQEEEDEDDDEHYD